VYKSGAFVTTAVIVPSDVHLRQYGSVLMGQHLIMFVKMQCSVCVRRHVPKQCVQLKWMCVCVQGHCEADGAVCGS
jgi:hypothetical protein